MDEKENNTMEIDLMVLLKALLHKSYIIILSAILLGGLFFYVAAYRTVPLYRASALMYVNNSSLSFIGGKISISPAELDAAQSLVETYSIIARSRTTLNEVISRAKLNYSYDQLRSMVSVSPINSTEIFTIATTSPDPKEAEHITNTLADVLPETIAQIVDGSSVRVVDYAVAPNHKVSPNITRQTSMGMLIGALISATIIVLITIFNDVIRSKRDLMQNYDLPVLTVIPNFKAQTAFKAKKQASKNEVQNEEQKH